MNTKAQVRARIEEIGIIPAVRVSSAEAALFAAEAVFHAGIPIVEITMTVPDAINVISRLTKDFPEMIVGAGTVLNTDTARLCLAAGARFLTSPGLVQRVVEFAVDTDVLVFPGALTPTEVIAAWLAGADFVKVFPSYANGGPPVHPRLERSLAAGFLDRLGRRESADGLRLHRGRRGGARHWRRADTSRSHSGPQTSADS